MRVAALRLTVVKRHYQTVVVRKTDDFQSLRVDIVYYESEALERIGREMGKDLQAHAQARVDVVWLIDDYASRLGIY